MCVENFWPKVLDLLNFLKNYPHKSEILRSTDKTGCEKFPCISDYAQIFTQKVMALRTVNFSIFWPCFETSDCTRKLLNQTWDLSFNRKDGLWETPPPKRLSPNVFPQNVVTFGKVYDFWPVLKLFDFSQKLHPKSELLVSIEKTCCGKLPFGSSYSQILLHKKLWPSE